MTAELKAFARQLHRWGANVTAIKPGTKRPFHKWKHWQSTRQTGAEFEALPWGNAVAVGIVNGSGNFRVFDIDAVKDEDGRPLCPVPETVLVKILQAIGLPDDYQWSYASGSGAGWGFIVCCEEALPTDWQPDARGIFTGLPINEYLFDHLELRWNSGQTVIAGQHPTGPGYCWRRGESPFVPPALKLVGSIVQAFEAVAVLKQTAVSVNGATAANSEISSYGQAALSDAIRLVRTTLPGDRNNILFQQTAALGELVNMNELDRATVEQGMTGAALAAGLQNVEIEATIASAFKTVGNKVRQVNRYEGQVETAVPSHDVGEDSVLMVSNPNMLNLRTVSLAELMAQDLPSLVFLVGGVIALGYLVVLAGRPKKWKVLARAATSDVCGYGTAVFRQGDKTRQGAAYCPGRREAACLSTGTLAEVGSFGNGIISCEYSNLRRAKRHARAGFDPD